MKMSEDDRELEALFKAARPDAVIHLAAETHVDRSIDGPLEFVTTNVTGTAVMLSEVEAYWRQLPDADRERFRFLYGFINIFRNFVR